MVNRECRILTIDGGDDFCQELFLLLNESGFAVRSVTNTSLGRTLLEEQKFDLVILATPGYYTDETIGRATAVLEQLGIADAGVPPLVILTYEPSFVRDNRAVPGVTAISLHDFEIGRFLESIQRVIGKS